MANLVIASNSKAMSKLDGSIKKKVYEFFEKLNTDDTSPALHIEPMRVATDPRVRTGRVDIHYRAVLFKVDDNRHPDLHLHGDLEPRRCDQTRRKATLRVNPSMEPAEVDPGTFIRNRHDSRYT